MRAQILITGLCSILLSAPAFGFLDIHESGENTPAGTFRIGAAPQLRVSDGSGGNVGFFVDSSTNEEFGWRAQLGTGDTDFWAGASAKWIPIPDYQTQPAIGLRPEIIFGRDVSESFTIFRVSPLISKKLDTEVGLVTPYVAVPIGIWGWKGQSDNISQFVIGSEAKFNEMPGLMFTAEMGLNMSKTFSYIAGSVSFFFDSKK